MRRMSPELEYLKAIIEGKPDLPRWQDWFEEHKSSLERMFNPSR